MLFRTSREVRLVNGDQCKPGSFVIAHNPNMAGQTVAKVIEILQVKGSPADGAQIPDGILLQAAEVQRPAVGYRMPHIDLSNSFRIARFEVGLSVPTMNHSFICILTKCDNFKGDHMHYQCSA